MAKSKKVVKKSTKVTDVKSLKAKYRASITANSFRKWLKKCKNEVIGISGDSTACPIAKFAIFTGFALPEDRGIGMTNHAIVGFKGYFVQAHGHHEVALPARRWARRFVDIVDDVDGDVTGIMGLKALELAESAIKMYKAQELYRAWYVAQGEAPNATLPAAI